MSGDTETWRQWLTTDTPRSRQQARLAQLYLGWLNFRSNPLAMLGFLIIAALVVVAAIAPLIGARAAAESLPGLGDAADPGVNPVIG